MACYCSCYYSTLICLVVVTQGKGKLKHDSLSLFLVCSLGTQKFCIKRIQITEKMEKVNIIQNLQLCSNHPLKSYCFK